MSPPSVSQNGSASTGYVAQASGVIPQFNGNPSDFRIWIYRFKAFLKNRRAEEYKEIGVVGENRNQDKNKSLFFSIIEAVDDKSADIIISEAEDDGVKALEVLETHYMGSVLSQKIIYLMKLATISVPEDGSLSSYAAELLDIRSSFKKMKCVIDDDMLTVMGLMRLPEKHDVFVQVVKRQRPFTTFDNFIIMLKEEDSPLFAKENDSVMKVKTYHTPTGATGGKAKCFICKQNGHMSGACPQKQKKGNPRWCDKCQVGTHYTERCWSKNGKKSKKKDSVKTVSVSNPTSDDEDSARMVRIIKQSSDDEPERDVYFMAVDSTQKVFGAMEEDKENNEEIKLEGSGSERNCKRPRDEPLEELTDSTLTQINSLLVDTGATSHIIKDISKFISFDEEYDPSGHIIELADGTRTTGWVKGRGVALYRLKDTKGVPYNVRLTNALYIPGYNQNILSVRKATKTGASFCFSETEAKLQLADGNVFDIEQKGKLYYLNHVRIKKKRKAHNN